MAANRAVVGAGSSAAGGKARVRSSVAGREGGYAEEQRRKEWRREKTRKDGWET
jgi:hypothetical protein